MANSSENSDAKYMDRHQKVGARAVELGSQVIERDFGTASDVYYTKPTGGGVPVLSIARHGITWFFSSEVEAGQYANGDWWVIGPVSIVGITPQSILNGTRYMHGSMLNLQPRAAEHGFDSYLYVGFLDEYNHSLNVGFGASPSTPLTIQPGNSLISVNSKEQVPPNEGVVHRGMFYDAAVLTVVAEAPLPGSFRPPWCRAQDTPYLVDNLNTGLITSTFSSTGTEPSVTDKYVASVMDGRVWLEWKPYWISRFEHPENSMQDYGQYISADINDNFLLLHSDFLSPTEKTQLLHGLIQIGIDLDGMLTNGMGWNEGGGHMQGRKWPIMFKRLMFGENPALGQPPTKFAEDDQTHYVLETSPGVYNYGYGGYTAQHVGMPEFASRHWSLPTFGVPQGSWNWNSWYGAAPGTNYNLYRTCCTTRTWWGAALTAYLMGQRDNWGHDAFFDYCDRYFLTEQLHAGSANLTDSSWAAAMWEQHRPTFEAYPYGPLDENWTIP